MEQFKHIKNYIQSLFDKLKCGEEMTEIERIDYGDGVNENNVMFVLSQIEKKIKLNEKVLEQCLDADEDNNGNKNENASEMSTRQVNDNMKLAFANMDINKIKTMEKIKNNQHPEDFKLENLIMYSKDIAEEVLNNINKTNQNDKKILGKLPKKK